ncbi:MgtC family protein [Maioricimonas rarisocia]|uniref:MgtC family protein n=2 Tax=Maioricimonas rarisocia TaxID=2528026 RepID=A0A517Z809_9PLAN|nr:MgtC family protein [Maioricimonas rarisocia]
MDAEIILQFAVSLGLGLLVGFQREWTAPHVAGIRTFAFVTLFGTVSAHLATQVEGWYLTAGLLVVGSMLAVGTFMQVDDDDEPGLTTHTAALLMYSVGAMIVYFPLELPMLLAGSVAVLLYWKGPLHKFVGRMSSTDFRAVMQLVLLALVILPVLPDRAFDPYGVLNPYRIWLMVVLICGISLGGYIASKFLGDRVGTLVGGILGGVISSTATTVSYSRRIRHGTPVSHAASVIAIASTIVFARVFVEVALVTPGILWQMAPPLATLMAVMAGATALLFFTSRRVQAPIEIEDDPSELRAALVFGLLYAAILFAVAVAKDHFGSRGLYVVAGLSGLTDMDAITLSTARFVADGQVDVDIGWRMILLGALSNIVCKHVIVGLLGGWRLFLRVAPVFVAAIIAGALILLLWPPPLIELPR